MIPVPYALSGLREDFIELLELNEIHRQAPIDRKLNTAWMASVIELVKSDSKMLAYFLHIYLKQATSEATSLLFDDPEMASPLNRAYEELANLCVFVFGTKHEPYEAFATDRRWPTETSMLYGDFENLVLQLDKEAARAFGEAALVVGHPNWFSDDPTKGIFAQKNLPVEFADRLLLKYPALVKSSLTTDVFSNEALLEAENNEDVRSQLIPAVRLTNPHLTDQNFRFMVKEINSNSLLTPLHYVEYSVDRWQFAVEVFDKDLHRREIMDELALNHNLPYEAMKVVFREGNAAACALFAARHFEQYMGDENRVSIHEDSLPVFINRLTPSQLEYYYKNLLFPASDMLILVTPKAPASLIEEIFASKPKWMRQIPPFRFVTHDEPNVFSIRDEIERFSPYPEKLTKSIERLDEVLVSKGYEEVIGSPLSWKLEMADMIIASIWQPPVAV